MSSKEVYAEVEPATRAPAPVPVSPAKLAVPNPKAKRARRKRGRVPPSSVFPPPSLNTEGSLDSVAPLEKRRATTDSGAAILPDKPRLSRRSHISRPPPQPLPAQHRSGRRAILENFAGETSVHGLAWLSSTKTICFR